MVEEDDKRIPDEVAMALRDAEDIAEQMILSLADGEPFDTLSDAPFVGFIEILERGDVDQETVDILAIELIKAKQVLIFVANVAAAIIRDAEEKGIPLDTSGLRPDFHLPDDMGPPTDLAIEPPLNGAEAESALRQAAKEFALGSDSPIVLWPYFMGNLDALCKDGPLTGIYVRLFEAFEHWEESVGPERDQAVVALREIAATIGRGAE